MNYKTTVHNRCRYCGTPVVYETIDGSSYAIEKKRVNFVPNELDGTSLFVNRHNLVIKGIQASDGQQGNKVHECRGTFMANKKAANA